MALNWASDWGSSLNNNAGWTKEKIIQVFKTATNQFIDGDMSVRERLASESDEITVVKGVHQDNDLHATVEYCGENYHVHIGEGANGFRVKKVTKRPVQSLQF